MKFPEKYIKKGKFKLHSGEITDIFYDVNKFLTDEDNLWRLVVQFINKNKKYYNVYVGIATGGAIIASQFLPFAMIKDGELKGKVEGDYCLIDDVATTENSLREAINIIGKNPKDIFVVVDRRKEKTLDIISMYDITHHKPTKQ